MLKLCFFATVVLVADIVIGADAADAPPCPNVPSMKNFDTDKWLKKWHTLLVSNGDDPIKNESCVEHINYKGEDGVIVVNYIARDPSLTSEINVNITGAPINGDPAKLSFKSPTDSTKDWTTTILDTDYDVYEIQVTCDAKVKSGYLIEVNSRRDKIPKETVDQIKKKLADAKLNDEIVAVNRTNCPPITHN